MYAQFSPNFLLKYNTDLQAVIPPPKKRTQKYLKWSILLRGGAWRRSVKRPVGLRSVSGLSQVSLGSYLLQKTDGA